MVTVTFELDDDVARLLGETPEGRERAVLELAAIDLYRRERLTARQAARVLGLPLGEFIVLADRHGIPAFRLAPEEWDAEAAGLEQLWTRLSLPTRAR